MSAKTAIHPLDPLSYDETVHAARLAKQSQPNKPFAFKAAVLLEPLKTEMLPYLEAERNGSPLPPKPDRKAEVIVAFTSAPYGAGEVQVNLSTGTCEWIEVADDQHLNIDGEEMIEAEKRLFENKWFAEEIKKLNLPDKAVVVADPWIYGADSPNQVKRMIHFLCYMRDPRSNAPDSNHYAFPLPIVPVMETDTWELTRIDWVYTGDEKDGMKHTYDPSILMDHHTPNEYDPELRDDKPRLVKPLHVSQPEGPSFTVDNNLVEWQKWRFRVGFNFREGLTIHDVTYDGRSVFYRLSFSDMTVPYGDPRPPLHRKQAFDLGDVGFGTCSNSLALGCDCLGVIKYFDGLGITRDGTPFKQDKIICMHEQDDGLLWKHTNYRTNKPVAARSRILILQNIVTVANYEYMVNWKFDQAGAVHLEIRATGILSTQYIDANKTSPYGTIVSPGVLAAHHQHIFSVRVDPAVDGQKNTLVYDDVVPLPFETEEDKLVNPYGVGFTTKRTYIDTEGFADVIPEKSRVFKIINEAKVNPISKKPVGYKVYVPPTQRILAHPSSTCYQRADFADHHVYATKFRDNQYYSGGKYTNQSRGTQNGIKDWIKNKEAIRDDDFVLYFNYGLTHVARVEDFPVMPSETTTLSFKPADFFTSNPSGDVPVSTQAFNKSVLYESGHHRQGNREVEERAAANGLTNGHANGHTNGVNGHTNGVNGHANGHTNGTNGACH